ncbi:MAG: putative peptidoglycan lipid flippase [Actinomycetota bacterium]|jgi:putative peptidoglycan lipid II flippase|nr:putative peptidoglycan lipid flippase [Actinomycetota bacterium]
MKARTLGTAAAGVAVVTVASRVVGFGRVAVLSHAVGTSCVGDTYQAANSVPNVVFEVVAGGALASLVVPVLAGAVAAGDRETASRVASALLSWTVALLAPIALLGMALAPLLMRALVGAGPQCGRPMTEVGARMLVVFMPQVVLYGVGIVLAGIVQAHHRFLGPAIAPLLSSLVVITAYLAYAAQGATSLDRISTAQELTLSVGTTLGVAVLSLGLVVPARRCGLRLRPTFAFPDGIARRVRGLALAGIVGLVAQQVALVVALRLAVHGREGSVVLFQVATAVFLLPWAVLAVPVSTTAFPRLVASAEGGAESEYADVAAHSMAAVLIGMLGGVAVLVAVAQPAARLLVAGVPGPDDVGALADGVVAFAPGLVGYGVLALAGRALYARGETWKVATATAVGWLVVAVLDVALVAETDLDRVAALGVGNTVGMTLAGALLVAGLNAAAPGALRGLAGTAAAGALATGCAVAAAAALPIGAGRTIGQSVVSAGVLALVAAGLFLAVLRVIRPDALRVLRDG